MEENRVDVSGRTQKVTYSNDISYVSFCYIFQMGFIQLNEDFIFIEPLNDTMAITGHPHRVYRQKRSMEEKVTEKSAPHSHYCGVISGNAFS